MQGAGITVGAHQGNHLPLFVEKLVDNMPTEESSASTDKCHGHVNVLLSLMYICCLSLFFYTHRSEGWQLLCLSAAMLLKSAVCAKHKIALQRWPSQRLLTILPFRLCGCSSMVERQLPKLHTRVRFSSPAPDIKKPPLGGFLMSGAFSIDSGWPSRPGELIIADRTDSGCRAGKAHGFRILFPMY